MMQLRRTLTWTAVGLALITLAACLSLVLSTTSLRRNVDDLDRAYRVSRLVSSLAHQSIRHELETSSIGRSLSEAQSQVFLGRAINRRLRAGTVRIAEEHAGDLHPTVEVEAR